MDAIKAKYQLLQTTAAPSSYSSNSDETAGGCQPTPTLSLNESVASVLKVYDKITRSADNTPQSLTPGPPELEKKAIPRLVSLLKVKPHFASNENANKQVIASSTCQNHCSGETETETESVSGNVGDATCD